MGSGKPVYETCQACCNSIPPHSPELNFSEDTLNHALDLYVGWQPAGSSSALPKEVCLRLPQQMRREGGLNPLLKSLGTSWKLKFPDFCRSHCLPQTAYQFSVWVHSGDLFSLSLLSLKKWLRPLMLSTWVLLRREDGWAGNSVDLESHIFPEDVNYWKSPSTLPNTGERSQRTTHQRQQHPPRMRRQICAPRGHAWDGPVLEPPQPHPCFSGSPVALISFCQPLHFCIFFSLRGPLVFKRLNALY